MDVHTISTGEPSTLGTYRKIATVLFGPKAVAFIDEKIAKDPNGENAVVIAAESQMMYLLASIGFAKDSAP